MARLDVAVQAGALAQQAAAQRGVVGDRRDKLIQAGKQLADYRVDTGMVS